MKKYFLLVSVVIVITLIIIVMLRSEKRRIKKTISRGMEAIIDEDIGTLMDQISFNYSDDHGGSYLQIKKTAERVFNDFDDFDITADVMDIEIDEDRAGARLKVGIVASEEENRGYLLGGADGPRDIMVHFERSPYEWKVIKVEGLFGKTLSTVN